MASQVMDQESMARSVAESESGVSDRKTIPESKSRCVPDAPAARTPDPGSTRCVFSEHPAGKGVQDAGLLPNCRVAERMDQAKKKQGTRVAKTGKMEQMGGQTGRRRHWETARRYARDNCSPRTATMAGWHGENKEEASQGSRKRVVVLLPWTRRLSGRA